MWFGTTEGLYKYNGYEFTAYKYNPLDSFSIINSDISDIAADQSGHVFACTKGGFSVYQRDLDRFKNYRHDPGNENSIIADYVKSVYIDTKERIWIGTELGLDEFLIEEEKFAHVPIETDTSLHLNGKSISVIEEDSKGTLWLGTWEGGLLSLDRETHSCVRYVHDPDNPKSIPFNIIEDIEATPDYGLWIGLHGAGLCYFDLQTNTFTHYKSDPNDRNTLRNNNIRSLCLDSKGNLWVGNETTLSIFDENKNTFSHYAYNPLDKKSLKNGLVVSIYEDKTGNIWVGNHAINLFSPLQDKFSPYYHEPDNPEMQDYAKDILVDDTKIWIATFGQGIKIYDKNLQNYRRIHNRKNAKSGKILSNICTAFLKDNNNRIWVGTLEGISIFDAHSTRFIKHFSYNDKLIHPNIYYLYQDARGIIWICTQEGINTFDPVNDQFNEVFYERNGFNFKINSMVEDTRGNLWLGSQNGLIYHDISTGHFISYYHQKMQPKSLSNNHIESLFKDSEGQLWIATKSGLNLYDAESDNFKVYNENNGFENPHIWSILEDNHQNMWLTTPMGITEFNPSTGKVQNYDAENGAKFNSAASKMLSDSRFVVGGLHRGFYLFHPDSIKDNPKIPPVEITNFQLFNKDIKPGPESPLSNDISMTNEITLTYKQSVFSFEFTALNYILPEKNQFAYMMEGFEEDWLYTNADKRYVSYTNLDPGEYMFRVKACNNDGVWNNDGTSLKITITPPWWQTWWFRISLFVFITAGVLSFYFWRVSALKARQRELERKVDERTSELKEANIELEEKQEEIQQQNDEILSVNEELKSRNEEISSINEELKYKNEEIVSQKEEILTSRDQLEKAFDNIKVLSEFGQKLTATFDFDDINKMIYNYVCSLMDTSAFGIGLFNEKKGIIDFPYFIVDGKPVPYFFKTLDNDKSLTVKCFKNKQEIWIHHLSENYKKYLNELPEMRISKLPESMIHLPLIAEDKSIGTLTVNSSKKNAYNETDINNLRTLASYISIALDNSRAYRLVNRQKEQITGSIKYGQTIQQAILPSQEMLNKYHDSFVLYRPKDIVSGDFYWFATVEAHGRNPVETHGRASLQGRPMTFYAVVDCTGHGVPGAFMSMIGSRLMNEIVNEMHVTEPNAVLEKLDRMVVKALRQEQTENFDGMDISLVKITPLNKTETHFQVVYAGAKRPLYYYTDKILTIQGTRRSIGGFRSKTKPVPFTNNELELQKGNILYLSSDGLTDQCNPKRQKLNTKRLFEYLSEISNLSVSEQKKILEKYLNNFQGKYIQRDDITFMGIKL